MSRLFLILLRIVFPFDNVARSRELMRGWLRLVMSWLEDPDDVIGFAYYADDRARLEGHIAALEYAMQVVIHERAREMLGLPFVFFPRQHNPKLRRAKPMAQLFKRLTQLARNFHNLEKLAARKAARMQRERDADPLNLNANAPYTALVATSPTLEVLHRQRRGRWRAHPCARDGLARRSAAKAAGGCASSRGCLHSTGPPSPRPAPKPTATNSRSPARTPPCACHTP